MNDIIIFGGGLSGLTLAHELNKKGFKILVIEKDHDFGGMARSDIKRNLHPSEHSWRGYAPFYKNTFQVMKEIPFHSASVFENLSVPIDFFMLHDEEKKYKLILTLTDRLVLFYLGINYLLAYNRRHDYYRVDIEPFLKKYLSNDGYNYIINFVTGPGYGMNKNEVSMGHLLRPPVISRVHKGKHTHTHTTGNKIYHHRSTDSWHVMNGPTSEVWIKPWIKYLKSNGVEFMNNTELVRLNYKNNNIVSAEIKRTDGLYSIKAKEYIIAINPYNAVNVFKNSIRTAKSDIENLYNEFNLLTRNTKSKQISFRIGMEQSIKYPVNNIAFVMNDSEFNITWYPQEKHWKAKPQMKSLWSGTIIDFERKGRLFNKSAEVLNKEQLKEEVIYQIMRSQSFQKLIYDNNGFYLDSKDIDYFEIWYEWNYINGKEEQVNRKWVNNIYNEQYRPSQKTRYKNLFLSGAHTKTTMNIWSMEGAIESGKITSNHILHKYHKPKTKLYKHIDPFIIRIFQYLDNILYFLHFPNIFICICVIIVLYIITKLPMIFYFMRS